jgi:hypothetical protein
VRPLDHPFGDGHIFFKRLVAGVDHHRDVKVRVDAVASSPWSRCTAKIASEPSKTSSISSMLLDSAASNPQLIMFTILEVRI